VQNRRPDVIGERREGRILIVDDEKDLVLVLVDILESRGYQVEVAHSVQGGQEKVEVFDAQVALLDVRLGRDSGIDLITRLKEVRPGILCVVMTAYAALDTAIEAIHRGAYDYLQKPLDMRYLLTTLDRCFEKLRLESEKAAAEAERERLLAALAYRNTQLRTAAQVSKSISTLLEPEKLVNQTVKLIRERFGLYYVGLFLVDETARHAVLQAGTGEAGRQMLAAGHKLEVSGSSMIGQCTAHGEARVALDVVGEEAMRFDNPLLPRTRSEMALPLIGRGQRCIGALTVQSAEEAAFSEEDIATLQVMADQLAIAIENARLYEQVRHHAAGLEERVAERTAELAAVNKELEAFAYSVSHDLRAPLRSIDGFSQVLLEEYDDGLDADGQNYLRRVRAASQRMGELIDDLLRLSRVTRAEMIREKVDLSALAQEVAAQLQETQPERQVEFVIAEGLVANGDARLLRVVLENLLGNAWKFTGKQTCARIEFSCTETDGKPAYFVRDSGAGFDMAYADKLFGAFQRLHSTAEFEGAGIGLATIQRIIHRHGGQVWAKGAVGQGATFYFTL
jgi:signal transduction histidine kinase/ActR/RegA family two-component response regulator